MPFLFSLDKVLEATAYLLRTAPGSRMTRIRLLKLLYAADRESLRLHARPITGDRAVNMRHGPVLSRVYDYIKGEGPHQDRWDRHFKSVGYMVCLKQPTSNQHLSPNDLAVLRSVHETYEDLDEWEIVEKMHALPEYEDPGATAVDMPWRRVLEAVGRGGDQAEQILREAEADESVERLLARARRAVSHPDSESSSARVAT